MCITVGERAEEEEEKICGQHFAFSGGQLQQAKRGSRGSCLISPAPCHPPPCLGAASRPADTIPEGKDHQKKLRGFYIKGMWGGMVNGMCCSLQGQRWEGSTRWWGWPGAVSGSPQHHIPTELVENSRDSMAIPSQSPQVETRTVWGGAGGCQAETTISHQGLQHTEVCWFPV